MRSGSPHHLSTFIHHGGVTVATNRIANILIAFVLLEFYTMFCCCWCWCCCCFVIIWSKLCIHFVLETWKVDTVAHCLSLRIFCAPAGRRRGGGVKEEKTVLFSLCRHWTSKRAYRINWEKCDVQVHAAFVGFFFLSLRLPLLPLLRWGSPRQNRKWCLLCSGDTAYHSFFWCRVFLLFYRLSLCVVSDIFHLSFRSRLRSIQFFIYAGHCDCISCLHLILSIEISPTAFNFSYLSVGGAIHFANELPSHGDRLKRQKWIFGCEESKSAK